MTATLRRKQQGADLRIHARAGEGNRTLMTSLEGRWYGNRPTRSDVPAGLQGLSACE